MFILLRITLISLLLIMAFSYSTPIDLDKYLTMMIWLNWIVILVYLINNQIEC